MQLYSIFDHFSLRSENKFFNKKEPGTLDYLLFTLELHQLMTSTCTDTSNNNDDYDAQKNDTANNSTNNDTITTAAIIITIIIIVISIINICGIWVVITITIEARELWIFFNIIKSIYSIDHRNQKQRKKKQQFWHFLGWLKLERMRYFKDARIGSVEDEHFLGYCFWKNETNEKNETRNLHNLNAAKQHSRKL